MAKKKKSSQKKNSSSLFSTGTEKIREVSDIEFTSHVPKVLKAFGILGILVAILQVFALFGSAGYAGEFINSSFITLFGIFGYVFFVPLAYIGVHLVLLRFPNLSVRKTLYALLIVLSVSALLNTINEFKDIHLGGVIGNILGLPLYNLFSFYPTILFLVLFVLYSIVSLFGLDVVLEKYTAIKERVSESSVDVDDESFEEGVQKTPWYKKIFQRQSSDSYELEEESFDEEVYPEDDIRSHILGSGVKKTPKKPVPVEQDIDEDESGESTYEDEDEESVKRQPKATAVNKGQRVRQSPVLSFTPPPLSLLQRDSGKPSVGDTKSNMAVIKRTLGEFGISVEMDEVSIGPSVTRYTLKPAQGVKLSRIANHRQELAYALRAESIRIEAPIPGKALVGIEIPNQTKSMVGLASLLSTETWQRDERPLLVALGKGISGTPLYSNLAKMPHVLIAGTTGSGKSVMVHAFINSLLFRNSPEMLKFIMVDPKKVELTLYNNIPHLYTPVITNAKLAIRTLTWAVNEMERRYDVLEENSERDISSYHRNVYQKAVAKQNNSDDDLPERMPYIVVIIDELADIMMSYPKELEAAIVRLAQKSRAVGIHLILSTQRPSVNVITGLIKANIPSRIALKVASQVDSRTIIDTAGAEQLLGQGDLLFTSSESPKQERVQSAFVSDNEVKNVVEYLKKHYRDTPRDEINVEHNPGGNKTMNALFSTDMGSVSGGDTDDDLFEQAKEIVISSKKASTSYLQRRLKIGYSRAARLMDMLEEQGIIGAGDGSKAREILVGGGDEVDTDFNESEE